MNILLEGSGVRDLCAVSGRRSKKGFECVGVGEMPVTFSPFY